MPLISIGGAHLVCNLHLQGSPECPPPAAVPAPYVTDPHPMQRPGLSNSYFATLTCAALQGANSARGASAGHELHRSRPPSWGLHRDKGASFPQQHWAAPGGQVGGRSYGGRLWQRGSCTAHFAVLRAPG